MELKTADISKNLSHMHGPNGAKNLTLSPPAPADQLQRLRKPTDQFHHESNKIKPRNAGKSNRKPKRRRPNEIKHQASTPVAINHIDVVHVEPLERGLSALDYVLPGQALVVGTGATPEDLGGDDDVGSLPAELADSLAHDLLGAAVGVDLGVVEEVDAVVAAALEERLGLLHVELVPEAHPRPVGELAHLQPRPSQVLVLHLDSATERAGGTFLSAEAPTATATASDRTERQRMRERATDSRPRRRRCGGVFLYLESDRESGRK